MKKTWKKHFLLVTPALLSCGDGKTKQLEPDPFPPVSYGPRESFSEGNCYVSISGNPPQNRPVSCTAPIEPNGYGGCVVASAEDPSIKIGVACEPTSKP